VRQGVFVDGFSFQKILMGKPFSIKIQLEIEKLAYVGFVFLWAAGHFFNIAR
jgi:hypothetical protein